MMESDFNQVISEIINNDLNSVSDRLSTEQKDFLNHTLKNEIPKYEVNEEFQELSHQHKLLVVRNIVKLSIIESLKLFKTSIERDYYYQALEIIIESIFKTMIVGLEAEFDKQEFLTLLKDEAHNGLLLAISVLRDEESIDDNTYLAAVKAVGK